MVEFKYLVLGNHPIFQYVNRYCFSLDEAENAKDELEAVGYEVIIKEISHER